mmetsp:Transcript_29828/g.26382  ORF Transcript_29828/g.26382 Transcript_29828/m.26382 type:complete len:86 (-) Transcript_29828:46-303(-)
MALLPAKDTFEHILKGPIDKMTFWENSITTIVMCTFCYICAVAVPGISDIITILGCTTNPMSGFLLPIIFYLKAYPEAPKWKRIL